LERQSRQGLGYIIACNPCLCSLRDAHSKCSMSVCIFLNASHAACWCMCVKLNEVWIFRLLQHRNILQRAREGLAQGASACEVASPEGSIVAYPVLY
jgi:hypothetical protein